MSDSWVAPFLKRLSQSYHNRIVVQDPDALGSELAADSAVAAVFATHLYGDELGLRKFLRSIGDRRALIFLPPGARLPFDLERHAECMTWRLKDVFGKLDGQELKTLSSAQYQRIYVAYLKEKDRLSALDREATRKILEEWLKETESATEFAKREFRQSLTTVKEKSIAAAPDWSELGKLWGWASYLQNRYKFDEAAWTALDLDISAQFEQFVIKEYWNLFYSSYSESPLTIDKVMHFLALQPAGKKALICFDGMGWQEWYVIKHHLQQQGLQDFKEKSMFAMLPSLTQFSRRALFCGQKALRDQIAEPKGFPAFVQTHWPKGSKDSTAVYLNAGPQWEEAYAAFDHLGIVINLVDDMAHAFSFAAENKQLIQKTLAERLNATGVADLLRRLLQLEYRVFITADHGSVFCTGNGWSPEKYLIEDKAKRALLYPNRVLANSFAAGKAVRVYERPELLGESVLVLPQGRYFFGRTDDKLITHGGIHPDEMIIPFVEVLK